MDRKRFKIGDWVSCTATAGRSYVRGNKQKWKRTIASKCKTKYGQIVGIKRFSDGLYNGSNLNGFEGDYEQAYLTDITTVYVWEIKCGMMNKVIYAFDSDVFHMVIPHNMKMPFLTGLTWDWTKENRDEMREIAANQNRGPDGKFTKGMKSDGRNKENPASG